MMQMEDRLSNLFDEAAGLVEDRPLQADRSRTRSSRRRRNRRIARTTFALIAIVGLGGGLLRAGGASTRLQSADNQIGLPAGTGPTLDWSPIDSLQPTNSHHNHIAWTGEWFVTIDESNQVLRSNDGRRWEPVDSEGLPPEGQDTFQVVTSGALLIASNLGPTDTDPEVEFFISDDQGLTWTSAGVLSVDEGAVPDGEYLRERAYLSGVGAANGTLVVSASWYLTPDVAAAVKDQRLVDADADIIDLGHAWDDTGKVTAEYCVADPASVDDRCLNEPSEVSFDAPDLSGTPDRRFEILASDDQGSFDLVHEGEGGIEITSGQDRFVALVGRGQPGSGYQVDRLESDDGRTWVEAGPGPDLSTVASDGTIVAGISYPDSIATPSDPESTTRLHRSTDGGRTWSSTELATGHTVAVGSSGTLVTGNVVPERGIIQGLIDEVTGRWVTPSTVIAWSADGEQWGWQPTDDVFEVEYGVHGVEFVVGRDQVIAQVLGLETRFYVADIPG